MVMLDRRKWMCGCPVGGKNKGRERRFTDVVKEEMEMVQGWCNGRVR